MMKAKTLSGVLLLCLGLLANISQAQSIRVPYAADGNYAGAPKLGDIAEWKFDGDKPGVDLSGKDHTLRPRGKDSRFENGALVIEDKVEPGDKRAGAATLNKPDLTPAGPFTLEVWFSPDAAFLAKNSGYLLDKKYLNSPRSNPDANQDYMMVVRKSGEQHQLDAWLGFGTDSEVVRSSPQTLEAGKTYHAALSYDGAGKAELFLNGERIGQGNLVGRGPISAGKNQLVIGDRVGSSYSRFLGRVFRVRLSNVALSFISGRVFLEPHAGRTAFARMEEDAGLQVMVSNDTSTPLQGASLQLDIPGAFQARHELPALAAGGSTLVTIPVNSRLRPENYTGTLSVTDAAQKSLGNAAPVQFVIVPRILPHRMPVIMWGTTGDKTLQDLKEIGFTHQLATSVTDAWVWENGTANGSMTPDRVREQRQHFDEMFAMQLGGVGRMRPGNYVGESHPEFNRVDRAGKHYARENVNGLFPRVQEFSRQTGEAVAKTFADDPGLEGALIHTEVRDGTQLSFHDIDKEAYRKATGEEIPAEITGTRGYNYRNILDFPANRVVPDDHRLLKFYRWFWKEGDGWNQLNTEVHRGLKTAGKDRFWTFSDPSVRVPSVYGGSGEVDYLSQWTYTYPSPLKIGLAGDQLFAMAQGRPGQGVMNMTQIIWYRTGTTSEPAPGNAQAWEVPESKFISIAPDHLSEALWFKLARPVQGIMYHGWGSLTGARHGGYKLTNPQTRVRLTELLHNVVQPLGPTLLQVPDRKTDVAFLESFSSQILAARGTYGWGIGWGTDSYLIANYAGLQPDIVYDETIQQKGLDGYKVLFLMHSDVLTQSVADKIRDFQDKGGIVIGDEFLSPGIQPDILLTSMQRGLPDETQKLYLQKAADLKQQLNGYYQLKMESSNPEVLLRSRPYGSSEYIFTINDHRTYGDYVGQYKKVMEKGVPSQSRVSLNRSNGFVYDLMNRREVKADRVGGQLQFDVNLGGGEGNLFVVTDQAAGELQITSATTAQRGQSTPVVVQLNNVAGQPLQAVVPLEVTIRDAQGRVAEKSGYYGAANGKLELTLDIAPNDAIGQWNIEVSERLRGQKMTKNFEVK